MSTRRNTLSFLLTLLEILSEVMIGVADAIEKIRNPAGYTPEIHAQMRRRAIRRWRRMGLSNPHQYP